MFLNGVSLRAFATPQMLREMCAEVESRALVIIHLNGANDGINNFIPVNQYDVYQKARPTIHIPKNRLSQLDTTLGMNDQVYYHPNMLPFKEMYDEGKLSIIQGVSYPQPNRSHFRSRDIWMEGSDGESNYGDGWVARYLQYRYPDYQGKSFPGMPDPLGIGLGGVVKTGFHTTEEHALAINLSGQDPQGYYNQVANLSGLPITEFPDSDHGDLLSHVMKVENSVNAYAQRISEVFTAGKNGSVTYPDNSLANQLKTVSRLINGGCQTKVFMCNLGGWDTHNNQIEEGDVLKGRHVNLLDNFTQSVQAFQKDLEDLKQDHKVLTVVWSEFGRKVIENGNFGTDHGTLGPMFVIGTGVEPGMVGTNIDLREEARDKRGAPDASQTQHDYRQVFGSLLQDWLGTADAGLTATQFDTYTESKLPLINSSTQVSPECYLSSPVPKKAKLNAKIMLEGFVDADTGMMHNSLLQKGLFPILHPYNEAPYSYEGKEELLLSDQDITDWVLLEVRGRNNIENVLMRKAAILGTDGTIRDADGSGHVTFDGLAQGRYYLAVYHKSHLAVISADTVRFDLGDPPLYDFTTGTSKALGTEQLVQVGGVHTMRSGDYDHNGIINNLDFNEWKKNAAAIDDYMAIDADGNGVVNNLDFNFWKANKSKLGSPEIQK